MASSLGKMPTTLDRRLISRLTRFDRVGAVQLDAMLPGECHVGQNIALGVVHDGGQLWHLGADLVGLPA